MTEKGESAPLLPPPNTDVTHGTGMYVSMWYTKGKKMSQSFPTLLVISKITVKSAMYCMVTMLVFD